MGILSKLLGREISSDVLEILEAQHQEVDLLFEQHLLDVSVTVLRKHGDFEVRVIK